MRRTYWVRLAILARILASCSPAHAQVANPLTIVAVEKGHPDRTGDSGKTDGAAGLGTKSAGPSPMPLPGRTDPKERRPPAVPLELPEEIEEETTGGLSLDDAIAQLLAANRDLAVKFQEIPKARADVLSAGLIENPAVFLDSEGVPYGNYSRQRPGQTEYGPTVILPPLDWSGKRGKRITVARRAERVLEALFQDAVRQEIDRVYSAHVEVLELTVRRNGLQRSLKRLIETAQAPGNQAVQPERDAAELVMRRARTALALQDTEASLLQARRELAQVIAVPAAQADALLVRGSLRDTAAPPPATEELVALALQVRPDLAAYQLSVEHARANVQLSRAERWDDVLTFYTPYQAITFPSQGVRTASGWEVGGLAVIPILERNQGNIARARTEVGQLVIQVQGLKEQVAYEVQHAATEYAISRQLVSKYEKEIVPAVRRLCDEKHRRFHEGRESFEAFSSAGRELDEIVERYLEALVTHRRTMLRLNTVVGQRILP